MGPEGVLCQYLTSLLLGVTVKEGETGKALAYEAIRTGSAASASPDGGRGAHSFVPHAPLPW